MTDHTLIRIFDLLSFTAIILTLLCWLRRQRLLIKNTRIFLTIILILTLFHHLSNVLEWFDITSVLDAAEDNIEILIPLFWGFAVYSYLQELSLIDLKESYSSTLIGWTRALELKDKDTEGHSQRVSELSIRMAKELELVEEELTSIYNGALLHDIGKMGIPDSILNKPAALTPEERVVIEKHPVTAYEMLKDIEYLNKAIEIPYCHHENWDGTGYPRGLSRDAIPISARIFSIVDNWDALGSDRPYRKAWDRENILVYIEDQAGKKFDPTLVEVFLKIIHTN